MDRIGVRELRQHASRYLDRVKAGATVEVTERGHLVALLVPPGQPRHLRDELIADGRLIPRSAALELPQRIRADRSTEDVLDDLRREE